MKKTMIAAIVFILSLGLCTGVYADTGLIVFAAASMTETLNEIKALYKKEYERLKQENAKMKKQLSQIRNGLQEINEMREMYSSAISGFLEAEKKYNELIFEVNNTLGTQRDKLSKLLKEIRSSK